MQTTAEDFKMVDLCADKGYLSVANLQVIEDGGINGFIPWWWPKARGEEKKGEGGGRKGEGGAGVGGLGLGGGQGLGVECAGINRFGNGNERVLRRRPSQSLRPLTEGGVGNDVRRSVR